MNENIKNNNNDIHTSDHSLTGSIPLVAFDSMQDRYLRIIKWQAIIIGLLIIGFVGFVIYNTHLWNEYDYSSTETRTITVDGEDGNANYAESGGTITNGEDNSNDHKDKDKEEEGRKEQGVENKEKEVGNE